jgi:hypothetical protein
VAFQRKVGLAGIGGVGLALILAGQSLATTWASPVFLSSSGGSFAGGIVRTGPSSAAAVYEDDAIIVKRTSNSGGTWGSPVTLSTNGSWPQIAGIGANVDVVWVQSQRLRYAHSNNGGASFDSPLILSPSSDIIEDAIGVARGPDSVVAVVWEDRTNPDPFGTPDNRLRIKVSTNGGASFGAAKTLASGEVFDPAVAIGDGVIYFAYDKDQSGSARELRIRRSLDDGANWGAPVTLANNLFDHPVLTAEGSHVYVSYSAQRSNPSRHWARYVRSLNKGASWSSPINLSPKDGPPSWVADVELRNGVIRAAFSRCTNSCDEFHVFYRQSTNGTTWTPAEKISTIGVYNDPVGVTFAGKILVAYDYTPPAGHFYSVVRAGTP